MTGTGSGALPVTETIRDPRPFGGRAAPYVRWWWLAGPFREEDIACQLDWMKANGFGGVEIAWLLPFWMKLNPERIAAVPEFLGPEWSSLVASTKRHADAIGLGCDFTFGSCWPFGGACVPPGDGTQDFRGPTGKLVPRLAWDSRDKDRPPRELDHLSAGALERYAAALAPAFREGLEGGTSALFCDSLEVDKRHLWHHDLWDRFEARYGYSLRPDGLAIDRDPAVLYDYRRLVGEAMTDRFYRRFTDLCHGMGALSRVQCHGAPVDLLPAYAAVDIPESEALLFDPPFSRIAASAAALAGKPVVSCETFTCLYGFPARGGPPKDLHLGSEKVSDLKFLADAVFAHGVNQIVWHGMPYNAPGRKERFYALVHAGPDAAFAGELPAFNAYLERASAALRWGGPVSRLAVYLPNEDFMRKPGTPPDPTPGTQDWWEMRGVEPPRETEGYAPLWISEPFLRSAAVRDGALDCGGVRFPALYLDVEWLDPDALREVVRLAREGLPVVLKRKPRPPGRGRQGGQEGYDAMLAELAAHANVVRDLASLSIAPLMEGKEGEDLPPFWARSDGKSLLLFFAHPAARGIRYPMPYGAGAASGAVRRDVAVRWNGKRRELALEFGPAQSRLVSVDADGTPETLPVDYRPPELR